MTFIIEIMTTEHIVLALNLVIMSSEVKIMTFYLKTMAVKSWLGTHRS